jgi:hypothetical protein
MMDDVPAFQVDDQVMLYGWDAEIIGELARFIQPFRRRRQDLNNYKWIRHKQQRSLALAAVHAYVGNVTAFIVEGDARAVDYSLARFARMFDSR